jgi:hypothetical protein
LTSELLRIFKPQSDSYLSNESMLETQYYTQHQAG